MLKTAIERMRAMRPHLNQHSMDRAEVMAVLAALDSLAAPPTTLTAPALVSVELAAMPFSFFESPLSAENPEAYRREAPSITTTPLPEFVDYGTAGGMIDRAVHHLDEGLPLGQRRRCALAYALLVRGTNDLGNWMRAKGYFDAT